MRQCPGTGLQQDSNTALTNAALLPRVDWLSYMLLKKSTFSREEIAWMLIYLQRNPALVGGQSWTQLDFFLPLKWTKSYSEI